MAKKKGDRFDINGMEISIADAPTNKPVTIQIKSKGGLSGKANLKMYGKNVRGSATIMVTKISGGEVIHVRQLAFNVVKYLLDNIISGDINAEDIQRMKKKTCNIEEKKKNEFKCETCQNNFASKQGLKSHVTKMHKSIILIVGHANQNLVIKKN